MFTRIFPPFEYKTNVVHFNHNIRPYTKPLGGRTTYDTKDSTAKCTHFLPCTKKVDVVEKEYIVVDETTADAKLEDFVLL